MKRGRLLVSFGVFVACAGCQEPNEHHERHTLRATASADVSPSAGMTTSASTSPSASASTSTSASALPLSAGALAFVNRGKTVRVLDMAELSAAVPPETWQSYDGYYQHAKTFRALVLARVLEAGFAGQGLVFAQEQFVLRAKDGYTVPMSGERLLEDGAYLAIADVDVPGWEPIGPQHANPGPFYLVWRKPQQQDIEVYPRPWQLASIEVARFEDTFPLTVPEGEAPDAPARAGFAIFREQCIRCHAMNQQGGRIGPDLNVPQSIVEYRPLDQIKAYIRDPRTYRYSNMPSHPALAEPDLDALVAYFRAMSRQKHDPATK